MSTVRGNRQAVWVRSPAPAALRREGPPTVGDEVGPLAGDVVTPLAGDVVTPLAGLAPDPVTTPPPCHKKRQVLYPFSSRWVTDS
ncbi:MAG: hypothetical protein JOZ09_14875 [Pseudonocardiales bacterium]|nr:hypothetical protein [Pseudonocardiales bacterium]